MNKAFLITSALFLTVELGFAQTQESVDLAKQKWIHGSEDCKTNNDPLIQVVALNADTWILRQNKCVHYEAPYIFLLVGQKDALLIDTGATSDENTFPLRHVVDSILLAKGINKRLVVAHTHSHGDHIAADEQFKTRTNSEVIGLTWDDVQNYFGFNEKKSISSLDLGNRSIKVLSIPGHHPCSLAFYDPETKILFTGDSFYPGRLYVRDWPAYKKSIKLLLRFAKENEVTYCIGNHVEMSNKKGVDYHVGTTFQPDEHILPLSIQQLRDLDAALDRIGDFPKLEVLDHFIIYPKY